MTAVPDKLVIRSEQLSDREAVRRVNRSAFETSAEADLVDALRSRVDPIVSLVAETRGEVVGHILFSPVFLPNYPELKLMGLAPMAVSPAHQCKGVGSALVRAGLEQCRSLKVDAVVVLGHAAYYPRFGFVPSVDFGIDSEYDVPADVFLVVELNRNSLKDKSGTVRYHELFATV